MELQKLIVFLAENECRLLMKYDGERRINKYTIRLLFHDINCTSMGGDTDEPCVLLYDILKNAGLFETEEIFDSLCDIINKDIEQLKDKFGKECVSSVLIKAEEGKLIFLLHIQMVEGTRQVSGTELKNVLKELLLEN